MKVSQSVTKRVCTGLAFDSIVRLNETALYEFKILLKLSALPAPLLAEFLKRKCIYDNVSSNIVFE